MARRMEFIGTRILTAESALFTLARHHQWPNRIFRHDNQPYYDPQVEFLELGVSYGTPRNGNSMTGLERVYGGLNAQVDSMAFRRLNLFNPVITDYPQHLGEVTKGAQWYGSRASDRYGRCLATARWRCLTRGVAQSSRAATVGGHHATITSVDFRSCVWHVVVV